jgi:Sec-independent protein translocase protein TatA
LSEFKRASNELKNTLEEEIRVEDQREVSKPVVPAPAASTTSVPRADEPVPAHSADQSA